jgi:DNA invertase Pin-like site-specific DNA recombinase
MIYGYVRVSTDRQDNSLEAQTERLEAYIKQSGEPFGRMFVDRDQSAYKIPLQRRREGKLLWDTLQVGDTVVFTKIDRCFRSLQDQVNTLAKWDEQGIGYHILDLPIPLQNPYGRCTLSILGSTSQLASELTGVRVREVVSYLKSQGRPYGVGRPFGWVRGDKEYRPSPEERALGARVLAMRAKGVTYEGIALQLAREGVTKPQKTARSRGYYSVSDVWALRRAAEAGFPKTPPRAWPSDSPAGSPPAAESDAPLPVPGA